MKFMTTWSALPGALRESVNRFLAGQGQPPEGVTLLGRWHKTDCSGGFVLFETHDPVALFESSVVWAEFLEIHTVPVVEDAEAGAVFTKVFQN